MKKTGCLLVSLLIYGFSIAQEEPEFIMDSYSGNALVVHNRNTLPGGVRQVIFNRDLIEIKDDLGEVTLINKDGKLIQLKGKGNYSAENLQNITFLNINPMMQEFYKQIWSRLAQPSDDNNHKEVETLSAFWGGLPGSKSCRIERLPTNNSVFDRDSVLFNWRNSDPSRTYHFSIFDQDHNPKIELLIRDTQVVLISKSLPFGAYFWSVKATSHPCPEDSVNRFAIVSKSEDKLVVSAIINSVKKDPDPIRYNLNLSNALGERGYIDAAIEYFNKGLSLYLGR